MPHEKAIARCPIVSEIADTTATYFRLAGATPTSRRSNPLRMYDDADPTHFRIGTVRINFVALPVPCRSS